jgi:hypothetical protein
MNDFTIEICGDVARCRTSAEIYSSDTLIAEVCDTDHGWQIEYTSQTGESDELTKAVEKAKNRLLQYVNRRGNNPPEGLTRAGLSLWLMEKSDGTAMGKPIAN